MCQPGVAKPEISVVIPLYNKAESVGRTLESVLSQTFIGFEVIVVDDGSTDGSVRAVMAVADARIRVVAQKNSGVAVARNRGIAEARGEFIALLDADDEWMPDYLSTQYALAQKYPDCAVFATNYMFKKSTGVVTHTRLRCMPFGGADGVLTNYFEVASRSHPPLWTSAVMLRRHAIESVGRFPVGVRSGEDLLTWARLAVCYKIAFSYKICACYNLGRGYDYSNQPPRRQDSGDPVGKGLKQLYTDYSDVSDLRHYISHWHKMRASVAIRYGERMETFVDVVKSLWYNPFNYKVIPFAVLACLPDKMRIWVINKKQ